MNPPKITKLGVYRWQDVFRPRWVVLDAHGTSLWFRYFWTRNAALTAYEKESAK